MHLTGIAADIFFFSASVFLAKNVTAVHFIFCHLYIQIFYEKSRVKSHYFRVEHTQKSYNGQKELGSIISPDS